MSHIKTIVVFLYLILTACHVKKRLVTAKNGLSRVKGVTKLTFVLKDAEYVEDDEFVDSVISGRPLPESRERNVLRRNNNNSNQINDLNKSLTADDDSNSQATFTDTGTPVASTQASVTSTPTTIPSGQPVSSNSQSNRQRSCSPLPDIPTTSANAAAHFSRPASSAPNYRLAKFAVTNTPSTSKNTATNFSFNETNSARISQNLRNR